MEGWESEGRHCSCFSSCPRIRSLMNLEEERGSIGSRRKDLFLHYILSLIAFLFLLINLSLILLLIVSLPQRSLLFFLLAPVGVSSPSPPAQGSDTP